MTASELVSTQRTLLAGRLASIQRCVFHLAASVSNIPWPLSGEFLAAESKNTSLFESLAAINERFAKLQDILGSGMRQSLLFAGEPSDSFLRILAYFEKQGVIGSTEAWQAVRALRNLAAHEYESDFAHVAEHFNEVRRLLPDLVGAAARFIDFCSNRLGVRPADASFSSEFAAAVRKLSA